MQAEELDALREELREQEGRITSLLEQQAIRRETILSQLEELDALRRGIKRTRRANYQFTGATSD